MPDIAKELAERMAIMDFLDYRASQDEARAAEIEPDRFDEPDYGPQKCLVCDAEDRSCICDRCADLYKHRWVGMDFPEIKTVFAHIRKERGNA